MYKISDVAKKTGFSISTLRYYEQLGILKPKRLHNGYREYDDRDIEWLSFVIRLKQTGMELKNIQNYSALRARGHSTIEERMTLLDQQEEDLLKKRAELEEHIKFLRKKKAVYQQMAAGQNPEN